jgi:glucose/arabinose dehydrogenase
MAEDNFVRRILAGLGALALLVPLAATDAGAIPPGPPTGSVPTQAGHVPLVGDWDGDGVDSFGVWAGGTFIVSNNPVNPGTGADAVAFYGGPDTLPLVGDWNGDGRDSIGVWSDGVFILSNSITTTAASDQVAYFGTGNDLPLVGDWDGDGRDSIGVYRGGVFFLTNEANGWIGSSTAVFFGDPGDIPLAGDWDGDGRDGIGIRRWNGYYLLDTPRSTADVDAFLAYGDPGDAPLVGDFDGVAGDGVGVRKGGQNHLRDGLRGGAPFERVVSYGDPTVVAPAREPELAVGAVIGGLSNPWDVAQAPDGTLVVTERRGRLSVRLADGTTRALQANLSDLFASGETGLMGLDIDPDFAGNRRIYTCQGAPGPSVKVVAWVVDAAWTRADRVVDPLVGGLPASSGRHGGCRLRVGLDGALWIGTGDAAIGSAPQNLNSLGGKVLRVDRFTGAAAPGNPGLGGDARVFSYGHRNVQGLAIKAGSGEVWTTEHGPDRDDEINRLVAGGNFGWDPVPGYNEAVPMTNTSKFPGAVRAAWSSGVPTLAVSGADFLRGRAWGSWQGGLAVATLKNSTLRVFFFDAYGNLVTSRAPTALNGVHGRLRTARLGLDGALYVTTDNGGGTDRVLRVTAA